MKQTEKNQLYLIQILQEASMLLNTNLIKDDGTDFKKDYFNRRVRSLKRNIDKIKYKQENK